MSPIHELSPWLADVVSGGLAQFLNSEKSGDSDFTFSTNGSNLFLQPRDTVPRLVRLTQVPEVGGTNQGKASDGAFEIHARFSSKAVAALSRVHDTLGNKSGQGITVRIIDPKFSISNGYRPPRAWLHVDAFEIINTDCPPFNHAALQHVGSDPRVVHLIKLYAAQRSSTINRFPSSNSCGMKSPVFVASQRGDTQRSSPETLLSQRPFASQAPLVRADPSSLSSGSLQDGAAKGDRTKSLLKLLRQVHAPSKNQFSGSGDPASGIVSAVIQETTPVASKTHSSANLGEEKSKGCPDNDSSLQSVASVGLDALESNTHAPKPREVCQSQHGRKVDEVGLPNDLFQYFQKWRAESRQGRYVSRRFVMIPKDQATILESDGSWQPPLVGYSAKPGQVPQAVWDQYATEADTKAEAATREASIASQSRSDPTSAEPPSLETPKKRMSNSAANIGTLSCESSESSEVEWSPTPAKKLRRPSLPPDSSPILVKNSPRRAIPASPRDLVLPSNLNTPNSRPEGSAEPLSGLTSRCPSRYQKESNREIVQNRTEDSLPEQTSGRSSVTDNSQCNSPFQVAVTPFKGYSSMPRSAGLCFHDRKALPGARQQDDLLRCYGPVSSSVLVPGTFSKNAVMETSQEIQLNTTNDDGSSGGLLNAQPNPLAASKILKEPSSPMASETDRSLDQAGLDPDYASPIKKVQEYRRQIMMNISNNSKSRQVPSSCPSSPRSNVLPAYGKERSASAAVIASQVLTSLPTTALFGTLEKLHHEDQLRESMDVKSKRGCGNDLYTSYTSAYPDYGGSDDQFLKSCSLLKELLESGRGPHPFLFDDAIFHHFHSFRIYLMKVLEEGVDAMPFMEFYNSKIVAPSHTLQIVTVQSLDYVRVNGLETGARSESVAINAINRSGSHAVNLHASILQGQAEVSSEEMPNPTAEVIDEQKDDLVQQSSQQSVYEWLDKAREAVSPELGTPDIDRCLDDIHELEQQTPLDDAITGEQQSKPLILPVESAPSMQMLDAQSNPNFRQGEGNPQPEVGSSTLPPHPSSRKRRLPFPVSEPPLSSPRKSINPSSQPKRSGSHAASDSQGKPQSAALRAAKRPRLISSPFVKPVTNISRISPSIAPPSNPRIPPQATEDKRPNAHVKETMSSKGITANETPSSSNQWWQDENTPFKIFSRQFANLHGEKRMAAMIADRRKVGLNINAWLTDPAGAKE